MLLKTCLQRKFELNMNDLYGIIFRKHLTLHILLATTKMQLNAWFFVVGNLIGPALTLRFWSLLTTV